jgi:hypothetical protein
VIILLAMFIAGHAYQAEFLLPALALLAWCSIMAVLSLRQRAALGKLDFSQALVGVQRQFEELSMQRLGQFKWAFLSGLVVWWVPFAIVVFKGVFGLNLYAWSTGMPGFLAFNLLASLCCIPLALWGARLAGRRWQHLPRFQRLCDSLAGNDLQEARALIDRLAEFDASSAPAAVHGDRAAGVR